MATLLVGLLSGCSGIDEQSHNDSALFLRDVPVARPLVGLAPVEDAKGSGPEERYTLELDGRFTVSRVEQRSVPYFGADVTSLDAKSAERLGLEPYSGVLVQGVNASGPAAQAGVRVDDVILSVDGQATTSADRLAYLIQEMQPGAETSLEVRREGEAVSLRIELGSESFRSSSLTLTRELPVLDDRGRTGLRLAEVTSDVEEYIVGPGSARSGLLVIENLPGGPAFDADLRIRDVILKVGGREALTLDEYRLALKDLSPGDELNLTILRDGLELEKSLEISEDELRKSDLDILGLVESRREAGSCRFGILWDLLFHSEAYDSVRRREDYPQNSTQSHWGVVLNLIAWSSTPKKKELRLIWLFPIRVSSE